MWGFRSLTVAPELASSPPDLLMFTVAPNDGILLEPAGLNVHEKNKSQAVGISPYCSFVEKQVSRNEIR